MRQRLNTLDKKVRTVLAELPQTRNSDITLTIAIWEKYHHVKMLEQEGRQYIDVQQLFNLPREDHVKRIRAKIQNVERLYLPTDRNILLRRVRLSKEWRTFLGYEKNWTDAQLAFAFDRAVGGLPKRKIRKWEFDDKTQTFYESWVEVD